MGEGIKKILLLAPDFYDYTELIRNRIRKLGFDIDFFDTRPAVSNFVKAKMKQNEKYNRKILDKYKYDIINRIKNCEYELIIVIACVTFDKDQLSEILNYHPNTKKIFYMWDSFCNYPKTTEILSLFDKNYSFDPIDCERYGLIYQPTFYSENCLKIKNESKKPALENDIFFIASFLPQRYKIFKTFIEYCSSHGISFKYHLYVKSSLTYLFFKIKNPKLHLQKKYFSFYPMKENDKINNILSSTCILDIPFNEQAGLTMRVLEALVLGKKIITTNTAIKQYEFYDPARIAVITDNDFSSVNESFLNGSILKSEFDFDNNFSVDNWIKNIVVGNLD